MHKCTHTQTGSLCPWAGQYTEQVQKAGPSECCVLSWEQKKWDCLRRPELNFPSAWDSQVSVCVEGEGCLHVSVWVLPLCVCVFACVGVALYAYGGRVCVSVGTVWVPVGVGTPCMLRLCLCLGRPVPVSAGWLCVFVSGCLCVSV